MGMKLPHDPTLFSLSLCSKWQLPGGRGSSDLKCASSVHGMSANAAIVCLSFIGQGLQDS